MSGNEERRAAAKRTLEQQLERRDKRAKQLKAVTLGIMIGVVVLIVLGIFYFAR